MIEHKYIWKYYRLSRRHFLRLLVGGAAAGAASLLDGCGGSTSTGIPFHPGTSSSNFKVTTNSSDTHLASATTSDGSRIDYYGTRNSQGVPMSVTQVFLRGTDSKVLSYQFDTLGRVTKMVASDGTQIALNWLSPTIAAVTAVSADGTGQVSTVVDTTKVTPSIAHANRPARRSSIARVNNLAPRGGRGATLTFEPLTHRTGKAFPLETTPSNATVNIQVIECGLPTSNGDVYVLAFDSGTDVLLRQVPAQLNGNGMYVAALPENTAPKLDIKELADTLATVLGLTCSLFVEIPGLPAYVCAAVAIAVAAATDGLGTLASDAITSACTKVTAGLELYCNTLDTSAGPGGPSLADILAESLPDDLVLQSPLSIQAEVIAIPQNVLGSSLIAKGSGPFNLSVDLGSNSVVRSLTLDPPNPTAGQDYIGTADIFCVPAQTNVVLSIVGTDGYTDSVTYTQPTTETNGTFTLSVPGAATAVMDVVTLAVTLPDGTILMRTASLVFG